jgi:chromosome segregation ATPase
VQDALKTGENLVFRIEALAREIVELRASALSVESSPLHGADASADDCQTTFEQARPESRHSNDWRGERYDRAGLATALKQAQAAAEDVEELERSAMEDECNALQAKLEAALTKCARVHKKSDKSISEQQLHGQVYALTLQIQQLTADNSQHATADKVAELTPLEVDHQQLFKALEGVQHQLGHQQQKCTASAEQNSVLVTQVQQLELGRQVQADQAQELQNQLAQVQQQLSQAGTGGMSGEGDAQALGLLRDQLKFLLQPLHASQELSSAAGAEVQRANAGRAQLVEPMASLQAQKAAPSAPAAGGCSGKVEELRERVSALEAELEAAQTAVAAAVAAAPDVSVTDNEEAEKLREQVCTLMEQNNALEASQFSERSEHISVGPHHRPDLGRTPVRPVVGADLGRALARPDHDKSLVDDEQAPELPHDEQDEIADFRAVRVDVRRFGFGTFGPSAGPLEGG